MAMTTPSPAPPASSRHKLLVAGLLVLPCILALLMLLSIGIGTRPIPPSVTWDALFAFDPAESDHLLVQHLRLPRALLGVIAGSALGVAGAIIQALTRNPLADPGILGVNAGAAAAIVAAIAFLGISDVTAYMAFGLAGAALAGGAVYALGNVGRTVNHVRVVLAGAALSTVLLSLTQIILINSHEQVFDQFRYWSVGSLQGRGYSVLGPVLAVVSLGLCASLFLTRALDTVSLGKDLARALGGNPAVIWSTSAIVVIVLAGGATAAAGPIAFVGLTAPHVARLITGPSHRWVLPYSMLLSAILMVAADTLGRVVAPPGEVGVGIMAALIGGPFFIALVRQRRISQL